MNSGQQSGQPASVGPEGEAQAAEGVCALPGVPERGRLLGVDYGSVRVGLAVSDRDRRIASPLATYTRRSRELDASHFRSVARAEEVVAVVLGLPVHLNGHEGQKAQEARQFGAWLREVLALPVVFWDERFTTAQAEDALWAAGLTHKKRKERRDRVAAQILLQHYLDVGCPPEQPVRGLDDPG